MDTNLIGSINEKGYLNGFTKRGYTFPKCILELVANVIDAFEKVVSQAEGFEKTLLFDIYSGHIKLIDNAFGMTREGAGNMFSMHNENHAGDSSRGVSGIGAKPSLSILSMRTHVTLFTRVFNGEYLCISVPWDKIHSSGKYTGMISVKEMTAEQKDTFCKERSHNNMLYESQAQGTTIQFEYNDALYNVISDNFKNISTSSLINPLDRIACVFGRDTIKILYRHHERKEDIRKIKPYDYFSEQNPMYYKGFSQYTIEHWHSFKNDSDRFIYHKDGKAYEINKHGKGYKNEVSESNENMKGYANIGSFRVNVGLRTDKAIFDIENPSRVTDDKLLIGGKKRVAYDKEHLGEPEENSEFLFRNKLIRNGQLIGTIYPEQSLGSARADGISRLKIELIQAYVYFNPTSSHDNLQDKVMGIQENKNQFDGDSLPKNFTKLIKHIKAEKANEIIEYFKTLTAPSQESSSPQPHVPLPESPSPESETPLPQSPSPESETPSPQLESPLPQPETPLPQPETPLPQPETPLPQPETPSPQLESPSPQPEFPSPQPESENPSPKPETPHLESEPPSPPPEPSPFNVKQHRKGAVGGNELIELMQYIMKSIDSHKTYKEDYITLFNLLNNIPRDN